jgi:folate-binding protein YgfZ
LIPTVLPIKSAMHPLFQNTSHAFESSGNARADELTVHALDDTCVLVATGEDVLSFLQGQITNDLIGKGLEAACLAGYCTAQGRLLATGVFVQIPESTSGATSPTVAILLRKDIAAAITKRLSMFVLRAKVKIMPAAIAVTGIKVPSGKLGLLTTAIGHALPLTPWQSLHAPSGTWVAAPAPEGAYRWWWLAAESVADGKESETIPLPQLFKLAAPESWCATDIQLGLPWIEAKTQDLFIPQTLNLDLIEGVSFTKGCYPGQEIVARSHYRGTLKRRMTLGRIDAPVDIAITPGVDVYEGDAPCGRVINVAIDGKTSWVLMEAPFEAMDRNGLSIGSENGPRVALKELPYAIRNAA